MLEKCLGFCSSYNRSTVEKFQHAFCKGLTENSRSMNFRYSNSTNPMLSVLSTHDLSFNETSDQLLLALERSHPLQDGRLKHRGPYVHSGYPKGQRQPKLQASLPFKLGYQNFGIHLCSNVLYILFPFISIAL